MSLRGYVCTADIEWVEARHDVKDLDSLPQQRIIWSKYQSGKEVHPSYTLLSLGIFLCVASCEAFSVLPVEMSLILKWVAQMPSLVGNRSGMPPHPALWAPRIL